MFHPIRVAQARCNRYYMLRGSATTRGTGPANMFLIRTRGRFLWIEHDGTTKQSVHMKRYRIYSSIKRYRIIYDGSQNHIFSSRISLRYSKSCPEEGIGKTWLSLSSFDRKWGALTGDNRPIVSCSLRFKRFRNVTKLHEKCRCEWYRKSIKKWSQGSPTG